MATNPDKRRTIKLSEKNYQELRKIKHKNMVESLDAALTIALGAFKSETKKSKATQKEKEIASKL